MSPGSSGLQRTTPGSTAPGAATLSRSKPAPSFRSWEISPGTDWCGSGRFTALFEARRAMVTGLDLEPSVLALARRRVRGRLVEADAHRLPCPERSFDVTVAIALLEFVADPAQVVAEMARVTRPHGRLVIGSLNPHSPWGLTHRRRLREAPWPSAHFQNRAQLFELGSRHGRPALRAGLHAPGPFPGLHLLGPLLEGLGRALPGWGAFQVLAIDRGEEREAR